MTATFVVTDKLLLQLTIAIVSTASCKKLATAFRDLTFGWKRISFCQQFLSLEAVA